MSHAFFSKYKDILDYRNILSLFWDLENPRINVKNFVANRAPWTWKKYIKMNDERFKNSIKAIVKTFLAGEESLNT